VHLSSDVVLSGDLGRPLPEDDPPSPAGAYGESKAAAEAAVASACPALVRTSLIYGGADPSAYELAALDGSQTFYADELRCPVAAGDLAAAVVELAALPEVRGPLHVAGPDAVTRLQFARLLAAARGGDPAALRGGPRPPRGGDPAALRGGPRPPGRAGDLRLDCTLARSLLRVRLRGVREVLGR
jgi:dTDP-4-dehydrorhamnose reductase